MSLMDKNLDIVTHAVSLTIEAAIMAGRYSGKGRFQSHPRSLHVGIIPNFEVIKRSHCRLTSADGVTHKESHYAQQLIRDVGFAAYSSAYL